MPRLNRFKQVSDSCLWGGVRNKTSFAIVMACAVAFTVVFNSSIAQGEPNSDPTASTDSKSASDSDQFSQDPKCTKSKIPATDKSQSPAPDKTSEVSTNLAGNRVVTDAADKMSTARPKEIEPLPNFHKVTDYLYRGGEPNPAGLQKLKDMGVKTLIDLRAQTEAAHNEAEIAKKLGMKYINMTMTAEAPTKKQVKTLLDTIDSAKKNNEPVLVHCAHGSDRTGCMIGIWRVTRDNWGFDETYKEMRKYYFGVKYAKLRNAVQERATH